MTTTTTPASADAGAATTNNKAAASPEADDADLAVVPPMLGALQKSLGPDVLDKIRHRSQILVVGAGGIGCELLKNLALCGFSKVTVIDLDTIDVSNLNRQLLFRSNHVGMPKCVVACEVAATQLLLDGGAQGANDNDDKVAKDKDASNGGAKDDGSSSNHNNNVEYKAIHGNVCDNQVLNVPFVSQFDVVLSALDNVTARRRVNRLCLAAREGAGVPLIEAGTTGYLGQVSAITRTVQCYECRPQEPPKVYPICTIRSTPSAPVHTIVWAKECYKLLFHPKVEESMLYEAVKNEGEENDVGGEKNNGEKEAAGGGGYEPSVYMEAIQQYRAALQSDGSKDGVDVDVDVEALARSVLQALYGDEIEKQIRMDRYKTARTKPVAMTIHECSAEALAAVPAPTLPSSWNATQIWTKPECASEFVHCLVEAHQRSKESAAPKEMNGDEPQALLPEFDKDDGLAMKFVTAASNLRNYVFGITPLQSYYSAKGIAGNIIPAIATTNAIVAGLQILQAFHILRAQLEGKTAIDAELVDRCRYVNCVRQPSRNGLLLIASSLEPPNPNCYVCRSATVHVQVSLPNWTLKDLLDKVLKGHLGFVEPALFLEGNGIWEEDEDDLVPNLSKKLANLPCGGIQHGSVVLVEDYSQDMSVEVVVSHCDDWPKDSHDNEEEGSGESEPDPFKFVVGGSKPTAAAPASAAAAASSSDALLTNGDNGSKYATGKVAEDGGDEDDDDDDNEIEILDGDPTSDKKRASSDDPTPPPPKKRKGLDTSSAIEID